MTISVPWSYLPDITVHTYVFGNKTNSLPVPSLYVQSVSEFGFFFFSETDTDTPINFPPEPSLAPEPVPKLTDPPRTDAEDRGGWKGSDEDIKDIDGDFQEILEAAELSLQQTQEEEGTVTILHTPHSSLVHYYRLWCAQDCLFKKRCGFKFLNLAEPCFIFVQIESNFVFEFDAVKCPRKVLWMSYCRFQSQFGGY